jgi:molybdate transport system ATP-binding protein
VAIGRALLSQPQLLLLDEPLVSLDVARREEVLPYLERLRDQLSIPMVYVSHQYAEVLRLANHVALMERGQILAQGTLSSICTRPELRALVGPDAIGAVIEGTVAAIDTSGLAQVTVGSGRLLLDPQQLAVGQRVRLQLLARDLILATEAPHGLSVRNVLKGAVVRLIPDDQVATLVEVDIGGLVLTARITTQAATELALRPGLLLWVLVKAVTLGGHVFDAPAVRAGNALTA